MSAAPNNNLSEKQRQQLQEEERWESKKRLQPGAKVCVTKAGIASTHAFSLLFEEKKKEKKAKSTNKIYSKI